MHDNRCYVKSTHGRPWGPSRLSREAGRFGPKRYAEPVTLSSTAHVDFPISGLAAFLVRSSRAVSTYLRSVLDARGNLVALDRRCKARPKRTAAICDKGFSELETAGSVRPAASMQKRSPSLSASVCIGPKRYAEPVTLSSTAPADFPISGLAAFLVRSSRAASTYLRSVLDARGKLVRFGRSRKTVSESLVAICDQSSIYNSTINSLACG